MRWKDCLEDFNAIRVKKDEQRVKSLLITSDARIKYIQKQEINKLSCNFILENYYSSAVEILHAILIKAGFKVNNHICLGSYLKDILKKERLYRIFETNRKRRNGITYYGALVRFKTCKKSINELRKLISELKKFIQILQIERFIYYCYHF